MKTFNTLGRTLIVAVLALAGAAAHSQEGVGKATIVLGQSVALTGPGSSLARYFHQGAKLYFDNVNAAGGIKWDPLESTCRHASLSIL